LPLPSLFPFIALRSVASASFPLIQEAILRQWLSAM
jgi:hypothetical protein